MSEQELLQAMRIMLKEELGPIHQRLDTVDKRFDIVDKRLDSLDRRMGSVETRLERLDESQEEVRDCVNALLEWADKISEANRFPLPQL